MFIRVFVPARMTSRRFPGKVLAPLNGLPVVDNIYNSLKEAGFSDSQIVFLTSNEDSDKPLVAHLKAQKRQVFKGSLENVYNRFVSALGEFPSKWIVKVTGDSPFPSKHLIKYVLGLTQSTSASFLTTTKKRTLPKGLNLEVFESKLILPVGRQGKLPKAGKDIVPQSWYRVLPKGGAVSVELKDVDYSGYSAAIDTLADIRSANRGDFRHLIERIPWGQLRHKYINNICHKMG